MTANIYDFPAAPDPAALARLPLNDLGNGMRLILMIGGVVNDDDEVDCSKCNLLFELGRGWIGFNGVLWDRKYGEELARKTAHRVATKIGGLFKELSEANSGMPPKDIIKFMREVGSAGKTSAMLRQAQSYLTVEGDVFDRDPMAINCLNGTLKMRWRPDAAEGERFTWRLAPHDPSDRITRCADVAYDPKARASMFMKTLKASLPVEEERGAFHRMMGYSSTGFIHEQAFFFNQGPGQDGKSTLLDACRETLGTYGLAVSPLTFLEGGPQTGSGPQPDLIALSGDTRLAIVSEPKRGAKLNEGLLKAWTSGSPISARDLNAKPINWRPVTKLVWEMNSFVVAKGDDDGIWRRIKPILFRKKVPDHLVDKLLPDKLREEKAGILNWLIGGVGDWLESGLAWPNSLKAVLDDYRKASSPFGDWLSERCIYGEAAYGERTLTGELFKNYEAWCEDQGNDRVMSAKAFGDALRDRQITVAGKNYKGLKYRGPIRLKTIAELDADIEAANAVTGAGGAAEGAPAPAPEQSASSVGDSESDDVFESDWGAE